MRSPRSASGIWLRYGSHASGQMSACQLYGVTRPAHETLRPGRTTRAPNGGGGRYRGERAQCSDRGESASTPERASSPCHVSCRRTHPSCNTHHDPPNTSHFSMPSFSRTRSMSATRSQVVFSFSSAVLLSARPNFPVGSRLALARTTLVDENDAVDLRVEVDGVARRGAAAGSAVPAVSLLFPCSSCVVHIVQSGKTLGQRCSVEDSAGSAHEKHGHTMLPRSRCAAWLQHHWIKRIADRWSRSLVRCYAAKGRFYASPCCEEDSQEDDCGQLTSLDK